MTLGLTLDELIAYVVLLSLPLWLLIDQLLFLRGSRRRPHEAPGADRHRRPEPEARAARGTSTRALHGALRPGQR